MFRVLKWLVALAFTVAVAVGAVVVITAYDELTATLPPIDRLLEYDPPVATRVYAADGSLAEEFYRERRYRVAIADIPPLVRNAFLAAEDSDFFSHHGVDFVGIVRAALVNLRAGETVQGASTITQQVVKALLLTPERSYQRKIKEILLSLRLEQHLSKEEILELYLNQIYLGDGNHGVGAAARNYFGKSVQELTPAEAAMLAGLPAAPSRYSPNRDPAAARTRQHYVLRRMLEEHFLSAGEYQAALREELHVLTRRDRPGAVRNYYTEAVRIQLEDMFGAEAPYNQGYSVHTSLQPRLQSLAEVAVRNGIERIDNALGYRGPNSHIGGDEVAARIAKTKADLAGQPPDPEHIYEGVVTGTSPGHIDVTVGPWQGSVDVSAVHWNYAVKTRSFRAGDIVEVRTREAMHSSVDHPKPDPNETPHFFLAQTPQIEAALFAIDLDQGGIAAIVGGYDFLGSQFNRALQAHRQPGSAFKPFIYSAALDNGFTPASILLDTPVQYMDHDKIWEPHNYSRDYKGPIRLRTALEQSRNVVSVKLLDAVGVKTVVDYLKRFRLGTEFGANLSLGLGTTELTLKDITEGYTTFANGGVKVEPVLIRSIEDKDGNTFFTEEPRHREALSPQTAAVMTYILRGVVERGTATCVKALDRPVAGKTGTTNEQRDAWFIGYTPSMVVGVWVGFDDPNQTMGKMGTGGHVAAPIWLDFMKPALAGTPVRDFEMPDGISCVNIDPNSGKRASEWTQQPFLECFKAGTEPAVGGAPAEDESDAASTGSGQPSSPPDTSFDAASETARPSALAAPAPASDPRWPLHRAGDSPAGGDDPRVAPRPAAAPTPAGKKPQQKGDDDEPAPLYPYVPPSQREGAHIVEEKLPPQVAPPTLPPASAPHPAAAPADTRLWKPVPGDSPAASRPPSGAAVKSPPSTATEPVD